MCVLCIIISHSVSITYVYANNKCADVVCVSVYACMRMCSSVCLG